MHAPITLDTVLSARTDLLASALSETEMVMLNLERGAYFGLEQTAKTIWEQLAQPRTVADLCAALVQTYQVDPATCSHDLLIFLNELDQDELLAIHDHAPAA